MIQRIENHLAKEMNDAINKNPSNLFEVLMTAARRQVLDSDTGLYNGRGFGIAKDIAKELLRRGEIKSVGVFIIDVDGLKPGNDTYGHAWGTELLKDMAAVLQSSIRSEGDNVFRIGGDEFAIILPDVSHRSLSERIDEIKKNRDKHRRDLRFSWGIGFATTADELDSAIKDADKSMYKYKKAKKR